MAACAVVRPGARLHGVAKVRTGMPRLESNLVGLVTSGSAHLARKRLGYIVRAVKRSEAAVQIITVSVLLGREVRVRWCKHRKWEAESGRKELRDVTSVMPAMHDG
jgi:hypothetical protein